MDIHDADHRNAALDQDALQRVTAPGARRRRRLGLALPALGLSALVLAGCGAGTDTADDSDDGAEATQSASADSSDGASEDSADDASESSSASESAGESASSSPSASSAAGSGAAAGIPSDRAELDEIISAAEGTLDGSSAVQIDDGSGGWEVTVATAGTEQEVHVSEDHEATVEETESDDHDIDPGTLELSLADAVEAAAGEQDGAVTQVDLDDDDDRAVWQVEFDDDIDVDVDADSGEILEIDR